MLEGSCACGSVQWKFDGEPDGATACSCTACRRYGVLWIYDTDGAPLDLLRGATRTHALAAAEQYAARWWFATNLYVRQCASNSSSKSSGGPLSPDAKEAIF